jgi:nicotinamide-nucleotide amidase
MAQSIRKKYNTDFGVSVTGIAGPGGGTVDKPVGTVWIAVSSKRSTNTKLLNLGNQRETNIRRSSLAALNMLREHILGED